MGEGPVDALGATFATADGHVELVIPDEESFEALRDALGDPVWLLGATWSVLTTNEFKRGRFEDALGAWLARQATAEAVASLEGSGVSATPA